MAELALMSFPPLIDDVTELQGQYLVTFEGRKDGLLISQGLVDLHNKARLVPPKLAIESFAAGTHGSVWLRYCRVLRLKTKPQYLPVYVPPPLPLPEPPPSPPTMDEEANEMLARRLVKENAGRAARQRRRRVQSAREHGSALEEHHLVIEVEAYHPYVSYIPAECWEGLGT